MKTKWFLAVVFPVVLASCLPNALAGEGWLPNLNPFSSGSSEAKTSPYGSKPAASSVSDDESSWRLTDPQPGKSSSGRRAASEPSTWSKFSAGTSKTVRKTTSYLTPWKQQAKAPPPKPSGSRGIRTSAKNASQQTSSGSTWYNPATWFAGETQPAKKIDSVPGFLGQARPDY